MNEIKGEKLYVALGASKVRRRLKGHGFGFRKVYSDGKDRAVIIHTATGDHLRELEAFFQDVLTTLIDNPQPLPEEDGWKV
jgi:DNA transformation protein and related proteins